MSQQLSWAQSPRLLAGPLSAETFRVPHSYPLSRGPLLLIPQTLGGHLPPHGAVRVPVCPLPTPSQLWSYPAQSPWPRWLATSIRQRSLSLVARVAFRKSGLYVPPLLGCDSLGSRRASRAAAKTHPRAFGAHTVNHSYCTVR